MLFLADIPSVGATNARLFVLVASGLRFLPALPLSGTNSYPTWAGLSDARLRWRGAASAGEATGFRNRHWTSAGAASKHVPIPFKTRLDHKWGPTVVLQALNRGAVV